MDFAKLNYLGPTKTKLVAKTIELLTMAKDKGFEITKGLMMGGFSDCICLLESIRQ